MRPYRVRIPWLGPLQVEEGSHLLIGAMCDPALGEGAAAVLVPVDANLAPLAENGPPPWQVIALHCDGHGRFRVDVPLELWQAGASGLLMLLAYHRPDGAATGFFPETWAPISGLPDDSAREALRAGILELLHKNKDMKNLEPGVIERNPPKNDEEIVFAVASCRYPAGFMDGDIADASYDRLAGHDLNGLLLLGDQVYLDATAGLFDPAALYDRFHLPYERLLRTPSLRRILRRVPSHLMLDDHEIQDNWEPAAGRGGSERNLVEGVRSYMEYQRLAGPRPPPAKPDSAYPLWYTSSIGNLPFFMADTRTDRLPRTAGTIEQARIMGHGQLEAMGDWLTVQARTRPESPKFVASPAAFLPRRRRATQNRHPASALRSDAWDGYPRTFFDLLAFIAAHRIQNVIFLSGDEHVSFAVRGDITSRRTGKHITRIYSIHSSGLYAPFPFANSSEEDLLWRDTFEFEAFRCDVSPLCLAPGDGFALLQVRQSGGNWSVRCTFDRAPGAAHGGQCIEILR